MCVAAPDQSIPHASPERVDDYGEGPWDGVLADWTGEDGITVILLTRLNGPVFALNPDLVERADCTPDTVITLVDGTKYLVAESLPELVALIRQYRALVVAEAQNLTGQPSTDDVEPVAVPPGARPNGASTSSGASAAEADADNVFHLHRREH